MNSSQCRSIAMRLAASLFFSLLITCVHASQTNAAVWQPGKDHEQIRVWPDQPPGHTESLGKQETLTKGNDLIGGKPILVVSNVSAPTITVYRPKKNNNGAALVVFPGGGFQILAIDLEGTEVCDWVNSMGMTCVLLKYRVPRSAHYWDEQCKCHITPETPAALQDAQRTLRLVRFNAKQWNIDPDKIGVIGFSAGGFMVALTSTAFNRQSYVPVDEVDKISARPDFAIALYPGHLWEGSTKQFNSDVVVTGNTPPTFLVQATDDPVDNVENSLSYYEKLKDAHVKVELHLFAEGGHAFGLRKTDQPVTRWPSLAEGWLRTIGVLGKQSSEQK